jgi:hypothetical protein
MLDLGVVVAPAPAGLAMSLWFFKHCHGTPRAAR